jgi:hypothetical protein
MERMFRARNLIVTCVLLVTLATAGCAQSPRVAEAAIGRAPATVINSLKKAIGLAESNFPDSPNQWSVAIDDGLSPPPSLLRDLDRVPKTGLSAAEKRVVREAKDWAAAYKAVDDAVARVDGLSLGLPSEAIELVTLARIQSGSKAFEDHVDQIVIRLLKKQTCALARENIDAATAEFADDQSSEVHSEFLDSILLKFEMQAELSNSWVTPEQFVDIAQIADGIVDKAEGYADAYLDVLESPNGGVAIANLAYLRICVLR